MTLSPKRVILRDDPDYDPEAGFVEFRLTYEGDLWSTSQGNPRAKHKHELRKAFHPQLKRLWQVHPVLHDKRMDGPGEEPGLRAEVMARRYWIGPYNFVPLVTEDLHLHCGIDILLLRPSPPGKLLGTGGDLDNRLKTLFDALRRPTNTQEFGGYDEPEEDEKPFFCLLEDDALVTKVSVESDVLLDAVDGGFDDNAVRLIISVYLRPFMARWDNLDF